MDYNKIQIFSFLASVLVNLVWAQGTESDDIRKVSSSLNQFALKFLSHTADQAGDSLNLALSPYTVWLLLAIIAEGARGETARQLENFLKIPPLNKKDLFRKNYKSLSRHLLEPSNGVQLDVNSGIFTTSDSKLNLTYQQLIKDYYGVDITPTDFKNLVQSVNVINTYLVYETKDKIEDRVTTDDIIDGQILMIGTLFFKGQWRIKFDERDTFLAPFFDESGKAIGKVNMMTQLDTFPYTSLKELNAHATELPYGDGHRFSMIVVLPDKNITLSSVLKRMTELPFSYVLDALADAEQECDENVQVYLPRFAIHSGLNLNSVLQHMGIKDVFDPELANFLGIFPNYLYLSRIMQFAKIEVDEEGVVAALSPVGRTFPPKFYANKNFAYFIVDKPTRSIICAGTLTNPSTI